MGYHPSFGVKEIWTTLMLIFQPIAIYFAFLAYKEFKGCLYDHGGAGIGGIGGGGGAVARAANTTGTSV